MSVITSQHERDPHDFYVEPKWAVELLLDNEEFRGSTVDPACGLGTIPTAFWDRGLMCFYSDIKSRPGGLPFMSERDFLAGGWNWYDNVVCNPPFSVAAEFIKCALAFAAAKTAMLLPLTFLASQKRKATIFDPHPPARVYVLSRRPSMPPGQFYIDDPDYKAKGGSVDYCWIVWECGRVGPTEIRWIG